MRCTSAVASAVASALALAGASAGAQALGAALQAFRAGRMVSAAAHAHVAAEAGDRALLADAATLLARIARRQGKLDVALAEGVRALQASVAAKDTVRECRASVQHAHALSALGLIEPALEESYRALRLADLSGDPVSEAAATEALAAVQWSMSQWPDAIASFQRMLDIAIAVGDLEMQSIAHGGISGSESGAARSRAGIPSPGHRARRCSCHAVCEPQPCGRARRTG